MVKILCFQCQTEMHFPGVPSRQEECPKCKSDVRCCRNCHFYDSKSYNECRENQAEPVREKDRSNFCGFFQAAGAKSSGQNAASELRSAADALFKKKS